MASKAEQPNHNDAYWERKKGTCSSELAEIGRYSRVPGENKEVASTNHGLSTTEISKEAH